MHVSHLLANQTQAGLQRVWAHAAWSCEESMELDQFVLFSSVAALLANTGQADYATANAWLDGLVRLSYLTLPGSSRSSAARNLVPIAAATHISCPESWERTQKPAATANQPLTTTPTSTASCCNMHSVTVASLCHCSSLSVIVGGSLSLWQTPGHRGWLTVCYCRWISVPVARALSLIGAPVCLRSS